MGYQSLKPKRAIDPAKPLFMREPLVRGPEPIVYAAGSYEFIFDRWKTVTKAEWMEKTTCHHHLTSFAEFARNGRDEYVQQWLDLGCHMFLDSGAFTFQRWGIVPTKGRVKKYNLFSKSSVERDEYIEKYIEHCRTKGHKYDCYANFDYRPDSALVYKMQKHLEAGGIYPFPVEHGDDGLLRFRRYIDEGYKFFGISKALRWGSRDRAIKFYEQVFNVAAKHDVFLHGFAVTDVELVFRFPWYSVDSTTWLQLSKTGSVVSVMEGRCIPVHVTRRQTQQHTQMEEGVLDWLKSNVSSLGFDFEKMRYGGSESVPNQEGFVERGMYNIYVLSHLKELGVKMTGGEKRWKSLLG